MAKDWSGVRNFIAFWIFGMANNFSYVVMLSAAEDIMSHLRKDPIKSVIINKTQTCEIKVEGKYCEHAPVGIILLADVIPLFLFKIVFPFIAHKVSFGTQHVFVVTTHVVAYLTVAFSTNVPMSMIGVAFGAVGSGLGENCYLSLSSHYSKNTISTWSSGTGGAGLIAAFAYAALTEPQLAHLPPQTALLMMLVVPFIFLLTYFFVLTPAPNVYQITLSRLSTWIVPRANKNLNQIASAELADKATVVWTTLDDGPMNDASSDENCASIKDEKAMVTTKINFEHATYKQKLRIMWPLLLKYVLPLSIVYYAQYLVNQGLASFMVFDCARSFGLSKESQYRWYQVLYQLGVFFSRSSINLIRLPLPVLLMLPVLQTANASFFFVDTFWPFVPHIFITFSLILIQGFVGGFSYVNSFYRIHKEVSPALKEFSLSMTSIAGPIGITLAGLSSILIHGFACQAD